MEYDDRWQRMQDRMARQQERWQRRQERWVHRQERWARRQHRRAYHSPASGIIISVAIIALGAFLLLDNLGIVPFRDVARYWPVILIALGAVRLADSHGSGSLAFGGILAAIGSLLLLSNLDLIYFDWRLVWPAILIALGILMLIRNTQHSQSRPAAGDASGNPPAPGTLNVWTLFGGVERCVDAKDFRGGEVSAMFGGIELDLRGAVMAEAQVTIDVSAMFGGVEIQVPETWLVEMKGTALFGGFANETRPPQPGPSSAPRLIVTGYAMFGGVTVWN